ncbi:TIGR02147 family protein [Bdellovibrio svalbardensis]|uniref:TIGR02147 family protein n=1 Tax=Bdellovibrio svalbardensis TaxID=2972972 RepID=A0ABT6DM67_9BACT|nr:TIGR02147 family protein [Bdellovibrio svalbardensis]MDG0817979.1 TIGR02147 family protein [Bdellovibrio svalbardensis]
MSQDIDIFRYIHYREYLKACLPAKGDGRGGRSRLAQILGCQPGYISLVLSGKSDFSPEHGMQIADYFHLNIEERDFLLLLIHKDRAGSVNLRTHYEIQIKTIQKEKMEIKSRIATTHALSNEEQLQYYESWFFTALHMCTLVPQLRSISAMSTYLNIPKDRVKTALTILMKIGLVTQERGSFVSTQKRIHLGEKGLALKKHHTNWRLQAINSLDHSTDDDLHYSSVMSISKEAAMQIKQILLKSIQDSEPVIKGAKDEGVFALVIDLFEAGQK